MDAVGSAGFVEESSVYETINWQSSGGGIEWWAGINAPATAAPLSYLLCPSDGLGGLFMQLSAATGNPDQRLYDRVLGEYPANGENMKGQGLFSDPAYFNGKIYIGLAKGPALFLAVASVAAK